MTITFSLSFWIILQLLILPIVLPLLVGLVTKFETSSARKAILLLGLSVVTSFLTNLLAAQQAGVESFDLGLALLTSIGTFVAGVGLQFGLLKPTGATAVVQAIGNTKSESTD